MKKNLKKYRIIFDRQNCIGAGPCTTFSKNWVVDPEKDGKAVFKGQGEGMRELIVEIDESELEQELKAAKSCPVSVIHIEDISTGKRLI